MQNQQHYKSTTGNNKYAWAPYPDRWSFPYICEKPQSMYACNNLDPPPPPPVPVCVPYDNDTGALFCRHASEPVNYAAMY